LLIEPHDDTRVLYTTLLEEAGYSTTAIANAEEALAIARSRLPDLIVTELVFPRVDGFALVRNFRNDPETSDIPVMVVTTFAHDAGPERALDAGAAVVVKKPTSVAPLLAAGDRLIRETPAAQRIRRRLARALVGLRGVFATMPIDQTARDQIRAVVDRLQVAVLLIDEENRCLAASEGAEMLTGYTRAEFLTMSLFDLAVGDPETFERVENVFQVDEGRPFATTIRGKDGHAVTVHSQLAGLIPGVRIAAFAAA
jgi:PAS domain S-box-containing protein